MGGRSSRRTNKKKQREMGGQKKVLQWCFGPPPVTDEEPLMSVEQFRQMHRRRHKGKEIQVLRPVHYLHPRAVMLVTLYRCLTGDPHIRNNIPRRLRDCLEFHRTMIVYDGDGCAAVGDADGDVFQAAQEEPEEAELGQTSSEAEAECSSEEVEQLHARISCSERSATTSTSRVSASLDEIDHTPAEPEPVAEQLVAEQAPAEKARPALHQDAQAPEQAPAQAPATTAEAAEEAAVEEEEEGHQGGFASPREGVEEDEDASSCDEAAYAAMLGSPVRSVQRQDMKRTASPARHGYCQPIIKINANAATGHQPAPMEIHLPAKGDGEVRRRFVYDGLRWTSLADAKAARKAAAAPPAPAPVRLQPTPAPPAAHTAAPPAANDRAAAERAAAKHEDKLHIGALLGTAGGEAGLRTAEAAQARLVALEAMIGGAEAELARLARPARKVSALVKTFHELEEVASAGNSPRITAPRRVPALNLQARGAQQGAGAGPQNPNAGAPNPTIKPARQGGLRPAAAPEPAAPAPVKPVEQAEAPYQAAPPCTPPRAQAAGPEAQQGFSTTARHFFNPEQVSNPVFADEAATERLLWSSPDFSAEFDGQPKPELAARHAAAAARHAAAAARHAAAAAKFAGLRMRDASAQGSARRQKHGTPDSDTVVERSMTSTVNNLLFEP